MSCDLCTHWSIAVQLNQSGKETANGELVWEGVNLDVIAAADFLHMGGTSLMPKFDGEPTRKVLEFAKTIEFMNTAEELPKSVSD
jgi:hypothetical protein